MAKTRQITLKHWGATTNFLTNQNVSGKNAEDELNEMMDGKFKGYVKLPAWADSFRDVPASKGCERVIVKAWFWRCGCPSSESQASSEVRGSHMKLSDFKPNDVVKIVIYDCFEGKAVVRRVENDKMVAEWLYYTLCYSCQSMPEKSKDTVEVTEDIVKSELCELELLERSSNEIKAYVVTDEAVRKLKSAYEANKTDLNALRAFIRENGCTDDGLVDAGESFEQGWNNAMEMVFRTLGICS